MKLETNLNMEELTREFNETGREDSKILGTAFYTKQTFVADRLRKYKDPESPALVLYPTGQHEWVL